MSTVLIDIRAARAGDAEGLSRVHDEAWTTAYRGILPGVSLEKMLSRRGPVYWQRVARRSGGGTLVLNFAGEIAGYATLGPNRTRRLDYGGEIYEIYLLPSHQGIGLGRRLFYEARRTLAANGLEGLVVWALEDNAPACAFYGALGGVAVARAVETFGDKRLGKTAFAWR